METKLIGVLATLVLSVGVIGSVYIQSAYAFLNIGIHIFNGDGNGNGNTHASAESDQSISHHTSASVDQSARCDSTGNSGNSGNVC